jgi:hypothetical protein
LNTAGDAANVRKYEHDERTLNNLRDPRRQDLCTLQFSRHTCHRSIKKAPYMRRRSVLPMALLAVIAIGALHPDTAHAQRRGGRPRGIVFIGGYFYDPFFGPYPWWGPGAFAHPYFPIYDHRAQVRLLVTPKQAGVHVDGYYAGIVDDFDGVFQRLPLSPGPHQITVHLEGYRTVHQNLLLAPGKSYRLRYALPPLASGERSEPPPMAPPVPPPPPGTAMLPRTPPAGALPFLGPPPVAGAVAVAGFGTLALRVQPADAEVTIDGERWTTSLPGERLVVQVAAGSHHVEIRKPGYVSFSTDIVIRAGETTPLNVSLSSQ